MKGLEQNLSWFYTFLWLAAGLAIMAVINGDFAYKSGTAGVGILALILLYFREKKPSKDIWFIVGAFAFSIAGDWFLSHMNGDAEMFSKGIALFFFAHIGYLLYALVNGKINWKITGALILAYLIFFFLMLYPKIDDKVLMIATLIYLLVSCLSFGASMGLQSNGRVKWAYVFGIFLILFSDTIIAFKEFLGKDQLNVLILPTYYLAHISITYSLIKNNE